MKARACCWPPKGAGVWKLALALALLVLPIWACASRATSGADRSVREAPYAGPHQLFPADVDVVARVDWTAAGAAGARDTILAFAKGAGATDELFRAIERCLDTAQVVWIGLRLGGERVGGDIVMALSGYKSDPPGGIGAPCGAAEWQAAGETTRGARLYRSERSGAMRGAPVLMVETGAGALVVVSAALVDPVQRILRDGVDRERLEPEGDGLVSLEARLSGRAISGSLLGKAPAFAEMAGGLEHARVAVDVVGDRITAKAILSYETDERASVAGSALVRLRSAMLGSDRARYQQAARSAHADVMDNLLRVRFEVPR